MSKNKNRCEIFGCSQKALWKFTLMGSRNVNYGCCEDYVLFRCIDHEKTINIDEKYILAKKKHPNQKIEQIIV